MPSATALVSFCLGATSPTFVVPAPATCWFACGPPGLSTSLLRLSLPYAAWAGVSVHPLTRRALHVCSVDPVLGSGLECGAGRGPCSIVWGGGEETHVPASGEFWEEE